MLRLSDFVTYRKRYYNQIGSLYLSFETIPSSDNNKQNFSCCRA